VSGIYFLKKKKNVVEKTLKSAYTETQIEKKA